MNLVLSLTLLARGEHAQLNRAFFSRFEPAGVSSSKANRRAKIRSICLILLMSFVVCFAVASFAGAATINNWNVAGGGSWNSAGNWANSNIPTTTDVATFTSGLPVATNVITLDSNQNAYALTETTGAANKIVQIDNAASANTLTLVSTDTTYDGSTTFPAIYVNSGLLTINSKIQLGNGSSGSFVADFTNNVNTSNSVVINGTISQSTGQTWGLQIDGNNTANSFVILNGVASYSGDTTIGAGGKLRVGTANVMPNGAGKGNVVIQGSGIFSINNVDLSINALVSTSSSASTTKAGSSSHTFTIGNGDATGSYTGTLSWTGGGSSNVVKTGLGTQTFGGAVTVANAFNVTGGTALLNSTLSGVSSTTSASATIGGTGTATLTGAFTANGNVAPGANAPGVFTVSAATGATFGATSALLAEIGGNTPGNYDHLNFTNAAGGVTLTSGAALNLSVVNSFTPNSSDIYYILSRADSGAFSTLFAGTTEGGTVSLGGGYTGQITYQANWTGTQAGSGLTGGNDVAIYNVQAVPEPASVVLLAISGLALLGGYRRRTAMGF